MYGEHEYVRRFYGGHEVDPVEAASIHIALEELRDRQDAYLEVEIAEDDTAERVIQSCQAVAAEMELRVQITVKATRHVFDARGKPQSEPSMLMLTLEQCWR